MTVGELIATLRDVDPSTLVVMQSDGEGNDYSPLAGADAAFYEADSSWSGEVHDEDGDTPCIVLYPVN